MKIADELERLHQLYTVGTIDKYEFEQAKAKLLEIGSPNSVNPKLLNQQLEHANRQSRLLEIDNDWAVEQRKYYVRGSQSGDERLPSLWHIFFTFVSGIVFLGGLGWLYLNFNQFLPAHISQLLESTTARLVIGAIVSISILFWIYDIIQFVRFRKAQKAYFARRTDIQGVSALIKPETQSGLNLDKSHEREWRID